MCFFTLETRYEMYRVFLYIVGVALISCLSGCERGDRILEEERSERASSLFRRARAAEQSGDLDEAIVLMKRVLLEEPKNFSAHLQLATWLQDYAQDYVGAIYHYNRYLEMRPQTEKATVAQDRVRVAEQLLAPQILKKVGDSVEGISQAHLLKEVEELNRKITALVSEKNTIQAEMAKTQEEMKVLTDENARLRKIVDKMRQAPVVAREERKKPLPAKEPATAAKPVRKPSTYKKESAATPDTSLSAAELKRLRAEAEALSAATGNARKKQTEKPAPKSGDAPEPLLSDMAGNDSGKGEEKEDFFSFFKTGKRAGSPRKNGEMKTYVVQPGDTLYRVAEKFYGTTTQWKKIRDANRANIDPDGRIRAGQIIVIP